MRTNLRVRRRQRHVRTKDMAERLGVTPAAYTHWENGLREPSIAMWKKIQGILEVPDEEMWSLMQEDD